MIYRLNLVSVDVEIWTSLTEYQISVSALNLFVGEAAYDHWQITRKHLKSQRIVRGVESFSGVNPLTPKLVNGFTRKIKYAISSFNE